MDSAAARLLALSLLALGAPLGSAWWSVAAPARDPGPARAQGAGGERQGGGPGAGRGLRGGGKQGAGGQGRGAARPPEAPSGPSGGLPLALDLEEGLAGWLAPQPPDEIAASVPLHGDSSGGAPQVLVALAGVDSGGFAAAWSDRRDGVLGLYLSLMDAAGELTGPERVASPPTHSRQMQTTLTLGPGLSGALSWFATTELGKRTFVRFFDGPEEWSTEPVAFGLATPNGWDFEARSHWPVITVNRRGDGSLVWFQGGGVMSMRFRPGWSLIAKPSLLNPQGPAAIGRPWVSISSESDYLVGWSTEGQIHLYVYTRQGQSHRYRAGFGTLLKVVPDPLEGGWWALVDFEGRCVLRYLEKSGVQRGEDAVPVRGEVLSADLAVWRDGRGVALLVERAPPMEAEQAAPPQEEAPPPQEDSRWAGGVIELFLFDHELRPQGEPIELPGPAGRLASDPFLAAQSDALCVAWTDRRERDSDIYYRRWSRDELISPDGGSDQRWNTDRASADQLRPDIDGRATAAAAAWCDLRSGAPRIYARTLAADGSFAIDEVPVGGSGAQRNQPAPDNATAPNADNPAVAVCADGHFLVAWKERTAGGVWELRCQAFDAAGLPLCPPQQVDPGFSVERGWAPDAVALPRGRGYALIWIRAGAGPMLLRLGARGTPAAPPAQLHQGSAGQTRNPSIALLDDLRLATAWDVVAEGRRPFLAGRLASEEGQPLGNQLHFSFSAEGGDRDPSLAAGPDDGFAVAWTGREGPDSDCYLQFYDAAGAPFGKALALTAELGEQDAPSLCRLADGSWCAAWEDDLSGETHALWRHVPDSRSLGPVYALHPLESAVVETRRGPALGPLGRGFAAVWEDASRSLGRDAWVRVLGPEVPPERRGYPEPARPDGQ